MHRTGTGLPLAKSVWPEERIHRASRFQHSGSARECFRSVRAQWGGQDHYRTYFTTLLTPTSGSARVLGYDVATQAGQVRRNIGFILGGDRGLFGRLTGEQNLRYFGALNQMNPRAAAQRSNQLIERVGLDMYANTPVERYSRGMKQRLHIARGLLMDPPVLFLDEPTIGLDPIASQELRNYIPELAGQGKTILLTTHYMAEADMLCEPIPSPSSIEASWWPWELPMKSSGVLAESA